MTKAKWRCGIVGLVATLIFAVGSPALAAIAYVQSNSSSPNNSSLGSLSVTLSTAQTAGDFNVVAVGWGSTSLGISSVTDTKGNTYTLAAGPTVVSSVGSTAIYYAPNIVAAAAGANTVTVTFSGNVPYPDVRVAEYSGLSSTSPVDVTGASNGTGTTSSSGAVTTTNTNDLLVGSNWVLSGTTGAGSGFTQRVISTWDGDILEDEIVTAAGSYTATAPISPSAAWIMQIAAFKAAGSGGDTSPPTAPSGLGATVISSSQVNLSWTASTDNVGVTGYRVERCSGTSCTSFAQIGTPTATSYTDVGLTASTGYSYRVRATDAAGNLSGYSGTVSATTAAAATSITYIQSNSASPDNSSLGSLSVTLTGAQSAGDLNVVALGWGSTSVGVSTLTDTKGNTYSLAVGPTAVSGVGSASIYYATNIAAATAGSNTVTVTFSGNVPYPDIRVAEYRGINTASPVDVTAVGNGTGTTSATSSVTTSNASDLLIGSNWVLSGTTGAGSGYTQRVISGWDGDILEDDIVTAVGSYSATAPISPSAAWIMQLAAFKGGSSDTTPPSAPNGLAASAASGTQINLTWSASTDNVGVTAYLVERCQGASCTTFSQIATANSATYSDTGLSASTSYGYRVRATDAAGNLSGYSGIASATTSSGGGGDTTPPTAPTGLSPSVISATQINLSWTASTDNVGVTGYQVARCAGASCTSFAQIGSSTANSYGDTGLNASTSYSYQVRATDAAGNLSGYSATASAATPAAGDTQPPSAPTNLNATQGPTQSSLLWTASTDNVGVTAYLIERCLGANCTNFAQIASTAGTTTSYIDTNVIADTAYTYRVRATDAANNLSAYSNTTSDVPADCD